MVERLARGPASVSEVAGPFDMSLPTVLQHLGVLETAGIVASEKVGRVRTFQLVPGPPEPGAAWRGQQRLPGDRRLARLSDVLARSRPTSDHASHDKENKR